MSKNRALIVGAGIAGLTASLALAQRGWNVGILETSAALGEVGAGLQLGPNATRVLKGLGLGDALLGVSQTPKSLRVRRFRDGKVLVEAPFAPLTERYSAPYLTLKRADLQSVLLAAVRAAGIKITLGASSQAGLQALDHASAAHDLLVGADGLHSRMRQHFAPEARPVFTGYEAWRAMVPLPPRDADRDVTLWLGAGKHCVSYAVGPANAPALNLVFVRRASTAAEGWQSQGSATEGRSYFWDAAKALSTITEQVSDWRRWSLFDMPPCRMVAGHAVLIGDAAHPVLPFLAQGAALAIEDAGMLGAFLQHGASPTRAMLQSFGAARQKRAVRLSNAARSNGRLYHLTGLPAVARDLALRLSPVGSLLSRYDWLYGFDSAAAAKALTEQ